MSELKQKAKEELTEREYKEYRRLIERSDHLIKSGQLRDREGGKITVPTVEWPQEKES